MIRARLTSLVSEIREKWRYLAVSSIFSVTLLCIVCTGPAQPPGNHRQLGNAEVTKLLVHSEETLAHVVMLTKKMHPDVRRVPTDERIAKFKRLLVTYTLEDLVNAQKAILVPDERRYGVRNLRESLKQIVQRNPGDFSRIIQILKTPIEIDSMKTIAAACEVIDCYKDIISLKRRPPPPATPCAAPECVVQKGCVPGCYHLECGRTRYYPLYQTKDGVLLHKRKTCVDSYKKSKWLDNNDSDEQLSWTLVPDSRWCTCKVCSEIHPPYVTKCPIYWLCSQDSSHKNRRSIDGVDLTDHGCQTCGRDYSE